MPERHCRPGETAVLRYVDPRRRSVSHAWPGRVVADSADLVALYIPNRVRYKIGRRLDGLSPMPLGDYLVEDATWARDCLRLMFPGAWYSVWLLWDVDPRRFVCWYVNMESPFVRVPIGFDTNDLELDVVVNPDLTWRWKDEDHLEQVVGAGLISPGRARALKRDAEQVVHAVTSGAPPFGADWHRWMPDASWPMPSLPSDWQSLRG